MQDGLRFCLGLSINHRVPEKDSKHEAKVYLSHISKKRATSQTSLIAELRKKTHHETKDP